MINGINHITYAVTDLQKSLEFYVGLLGLELVGSWENGAYLLAGSQWIALNVDENRSTEPTADYSHISFNTIQEDFVILKSKLIEAGVKPFKENTSEGESFYFLDPDGHKLELHYNTLDDRLKWAKETGWKTFVVNEVLKENK